jgi:hypothetical protein
MPDELRAKFQELSEKTLPVLAKALEDSDARIRLEAARIIADRAWGRPHSTSDVTVDAQDPAQAHLAALIDLVEKRRAPDEDAPVN